MAAIPSSPLIQDGAHGGYRISGAQESYQSENSTTHQLQSLQDTELSNRLNGAFHSYSQKHKQIINGTTKSQKFPITPANKASPDPQTFENARPRFIGEISRNGSEPDSLIDLYRQQKVGADQNSGEHTQEMESPADIEDPNSKWVHRDKLTMIEIQEYKERGMEPPPELLARAAMRPDSRRSKKSRVESQERGQKESKRQRIRSLSPAQGEEQEDGYYIPEDPRTAEEIAADANNEDCHQDTMYSYGKLRSSSSRIPIATTSPHPIPSEHLERSTPLPRKRAQSNADGEDDALTYSKTRSRADSIGSQVLLDDAEVGTNTPLSPESPSKQRTVKSQGHQRKTSATIKVVSSTTPTTTTKPRTSSAANRNSPGRPGTRSGLESRPRTAVNPPEGDPPWLDTMYKPDPRLPPDQQMLPTHAKRLMQEQWEREGKAGSVYDRNFTPVSLMNESNVSEKPLPEPAPAPSPSPPKPPMKLALPPKRGDSLQNELLRKPDGNSENPKSPSYSTMPKLQTTPSIPAAPSPRIQKPEQSFQPEQPDEEKKSSGCGCCIIM